MILRRLSILALLVLAGGVGGCDWWAEPPAINHYYHGAQQIHHITRVVFVQLRDETGYPEMAESMTASLVEAMRGSGQFRVDVIPLTHPDLRDLWLAKREPFTVHELKAIRESLRCDAICFGAMTNYDPYPNMKLGLYLRLIDLKDGQLAWAVDHVWDSTDRETVKRIRRYLFENLRETYQPMGDEIGIVSPTKFQKFISHEVMTTLTPEAFDKSLPRSLWESYPVQKFGRNQETFWKDVQEDI